MPAGACLEEGQCGFNDVALTIAVFIKFSLGIIGAVALLFFVWGGVQWVISGGNSERVRRGQQIMINTSMALVVAFGSYILLSFFTNNIINVSGPYQIASVCEKDSSGPNTSCGEAQVCSGNAFTGESAIYNKTCLTKCQLKALQDTNNSWACGSLSGLISSGIDPQENIDFVKDLCPGKNDEVCINYSSVDVKLILKNIKPK